MNNVLLTTITLVACAVLWVAGFRLFLRSALTPARKASWTLILLLVGAAIGSLLSLDAIWRRFLVLLMALPLLGAADVFLLRSSRGVSFWIRACGFEVCTVFAAAAVARHVLGLVGVGPYLQGAR